MSRYRTIRVQLFDRQNKVQDQQTMHRIGRVKVQDEQCPATRQAKQGTGSAGNAQDRKGQGTGRAGSSFLIGKTRYRISRQCTGQEGSSYRTGKVRYRISRQCAGQEGSSDRVLERKYRA